MYVCLCFAMSPSGRPLVYSHLLYHPAVVRLSRSTCYIAQRSSACSPPPSSSPTSTPQLLSVEDPVEVLLCGCAFHSECIERYLAKEHDDDVEKETRATMRCPKCRALPPGVESIPGAAPIKVVDAAVPAVAAVPAHDGEIAEDDAPAAPVRGAEDPAPAAPVPGAEDAAPAALVPGAAEGAPAPPAPVTEDAVSADADAAGPEPLDGEPLDGEPLDGEPLDDHSMIGVEEATSILKSVSQSALPFEHKVIEVHGGIRSHRGEAVIWCNWCGFPCDVALVRLRNKTKGWWRCNKCDVKVVQLHRGFGTWPTPEFDNLPNEAKVAFYADVRAKCGDDSIVQAQLVLSQHETHEKTYELGGRFLPLDVWERKGFDSKAIAARTQPHNIQEHAVLGCKCYRLEILGTAVKGSEGTTRREVLTGNARKRAKITDLLARNAASSPSNPMKLGDTPSQVQAASSPAAVEVGAVKPAEGTAKPADGAADEQKGSEGDSDSDSSDSSNSDSSNSSSEKGKKKGKKNKKDKKDKKKQKKKKKKKKKNKKDKKDKKDKQDKKDKEAEKEARRKKKEEEREEKKKEMAEAREAERALEKQRKDREANVAHAKKIREKIIAANNSLTISMCLNGYSALQESIKQIGECVKVTFREWLVSISGVEANPDIELPTQKEWILK